MNKAFDTNCTNLQWSSWSFYEGGEARLIGIDAMDGGKIQERRMRPLKITKGAAPPLGA
jgi:hypothetical protein